MDLFSQVLETYARRYALSASQRVLLRSAAAGLTGEPLATAMNIRLSELIVLEKLFQARTGRPVQDAVNEIGAIARLRGSRQPVRPTEC